MGGTERENMVLKDWWRRDVAKRGPTWESQVGLCDVTGGPDKHSQCYTCMEAVFQAILEEWQLSSSEVLTTVG